MTNQNKNKPQRNVKQERARAGAGRPKADRSKPSGLKTGQAGHLAPPTSSTRRQWRLTSQNGAKKCV